MERKRRYFENREFDSSEKLKPYDPYDKELPITYTSGCSRRLMKAASRPLVPLEPNLGYVLINPAYEEGAMEACHNYQKILAINILANIYGEPVSMDDIDDITPEIALEIIERFYPSNYNWIISNDSRGYVRGTIQDPRDRLMELKELFSDDPEVRKKYFKVDYKTGQYLRPAVNDGENM